MNIKTLAFIACITITAVCANAGPALRIGLVRHFAHAKMVTISVDTKARLVNEKDELLATGPGEWRVNVDSDGVTLCTLNDAPVGCGGLVRVQPTNTESITKIRLPGDTRAYRYRSTIDICVGKSAGTLKIVNEVDVETYLRGVIAREMGEDAPAEALKAQTIVARTYALKVRGKYPAEGYDLTDTTDCQVYDGVNAEKPATDAVVRDTEGMVVTRNGALVFTDYCDDCGGVTANDEDNSVPTSVLDRPSDDEPEYCANGKNHAWTLTITPKALEQVIAKSVGLVKSVSIAVKDPTGRVAKVAVSGADGNAAYTGAKFRAMIGYAKIKSAMFSVKRDEAGNFVFTGKGYGHGIGLCQTGAMRMAKAPYIASCADILAHYFPQTEVVHLNESAIRQVALPSRNGVKRIPAKPNKRAVRPRRVKPSAKPADNN